jgi:hypothetical protein
MRGQTRPLLFQPCPQDTLSQSLGEGCICLHPDLGTQTRGCGEPPKQAT